jgi:uncharacterized protein (UPF0332 family)
VSPRSEEFIAEARERLRVARAAVETGAFSAAVSLAYYAMLNAARAALSEEDLYSKTHSGAWHLFRETFVHTGRFDASLASRAGRTRELRLGADYEAQPVAPADAEDAVALAEEFVAAIEALYAD